jgi:hypothetical protein
MPARGSSGDRMATELSLSQAFDRLVTILNGNRLGWVVAQVEDEIRLGKPVTRRVKELKLANYPAEPLHGSGETKRWNPDAKLNFEQQSLTPMPSG